MSTSISTNILTSILISVLTSILISIIKGTLKVRFDLYCPIGVLIHFILTIQLS